MHACFTDRRRFASISMLEDQMHARIEVYERFHVCSIVAYLCPDIHTYAQTSCRIINDNIRF